jgi:hypothetical protein
MGIIAEAREMHARGEPWWARPLVLALDTKRKGLSFAWVERCVRLLLPCTDTDAHASLLADIEDLRGYRERGASREELLERARAIWYKPPSRDVARTAVAKLYEAAVQPDERLPRYAIRMAAPINNFLWAASNPQELLELAVAEFVRIAGEHGVEIAEPS